jgi:hypothetical protein
MKQKVLVITNFSAAAQNALTYACQLLDPERYDFLLAHIFRLPLMYTVEGVALASISETLRDIEERLNEELARVQQQFPQVNISGQYIVGGLVESSRELVSTHEPELLIFGTAGYFSDLWHTDSELLLALRNITIPVMIVPQHIQFHPVRQIGFACDYKNICVPKQISFIQKLVQQTGARLHVVHVTRSKPDDDLMKKNEAMLHVALSEVEPLYYSIENPEVFRAIDRFVQANKLDMLVVIPRKQEFWYSLFHKSNIDQLAFLNRLPLLALPD